MDYDFVRIEREDAGRSVVAATRRKGWFRLEIPGGEGTLTAWCRLTELDRELKRVVVYIGPFYKVLAYLDDYRRRLEEEAGGWPGPPDNVFFRAGHGPEDEDAYEEQAMRLAEYVTKILTFTVRTERWDLLLGYLPLVDEIEHAFEPGPGGGSQERVERAFAPADRFVAAIAALLYPRDSLFIQSDHGMVPLTKAVNIEKLLVQRGWTIARENDAPAAGARRVQVEASSGIAHLYVDPALPAAERAAAVEALRKDVEGLIRFGTLLIDEVFVRASLSRVQLDNPRSGDVVVLLAPGIEFWDSGTDVVGMPHHKDGHGYRIGSPALDACFMALGPGITPARPAAVSLLDVAPSVARALGIKPPGRMGSSIPRGNAPGGQGGAAHASPGQTRGHLSPGSKPGWKGPGTGARRSAMPNPNAIVSTTIRLEPPLDRAPAEILILARDRLALQTRSIQVGPPPYANYP